LTETGLSDVAKNAARNPYEPRAAQYTRLGRSAEEFAAQLPAHVGVDRESEHLQRSRGEIEDRHVTALGLPGERRARREEDALQVMIGMDARVQGETP
jgi:hypothetical protein